MKCGRLGFNPWVGKTPWRKEWQPTPVFLLGEFHEQKSLEGYSPWGHKESDMTEQLSTWPGNRAIPEDKTQSQGTSFSEKKPIFSVYYVLLIQYLNRISQTFIKTLVFLFDGLFI